MGIMRETKVQRLDKTLSGMGLGSRKQVRDIIRAGRVRVDGAVATDPGVLVRPESQALALDGEALSYQREHYVMLHKPAGLVTAADDPRLPTVMSLLPPLYPAAGVMPVGRLDRDTTGLLLLTNQGQLAHRLLSPKRHVDKVYWVQVDAPLDARDVLAFAQGLQLSDFTAKPAALQILDKTTARLTLTEGKFHQVKRMMAACGKQVLALHRVSFGPLRLEEGLAPGAFRPLSNEEICALYEASGGNHQP